MHQNQPEGDLTDEQLLLIFIGAAAVALGVIPLANIFAPVRTWILEHHILVTGKDMVIDVFGTGMGFDVLRLIIVIALGILLIAIIGGIVHHRRVRSAQE